MTRSSLFAACFVVVLAAATAFGAISSATVDIGGAGSESFVGKKHSNDGLLSRGEVATATFGYVVDPTLGGATLTLTVTNTSPAALPSYKYAWASVPAHHILADAPVITDIFLSLPTDVTGVTLDSVNGVDAKKSSWKAILDQNGTPGSQYGFLNGVFDLHVEAKHAGKNGQTIASIHDPSLRDDPGKPFAGPVSFEFSLTFSGGVTPAGFNANWFKDNAILGVPDYIAAARFISGVNTGHGTVTNVVPEPATAVMLLTSLSALGLRGLRRRVWKK